MVEKLSEWIISNALAASVLALVALAVSLVCRRKPALVHACWLLVLIKLLTPPLFTVPIPKLITTASQITEKVSQPEQPKTSQPIEVARVPTPKGPNVEVVDLSEMEVADIFELIDLGLYGVDPVPEKTLPSLPPSQAQATEKKDQPLPAESPALENVTARPMIFAAGSSFIGQFSSYGRLALNWLANEWIRVFLTAALAGSGLLLIFVWVRIHRLSRLLRFGETAPETVQAELTKLCQEFGLRQKPELVLVAGRVGPLLWQGWTKPFIVLPLGLIERITPAELRTVLAHELTHYRRGDHLWRYLELSALLFYWWLPFAWLASRRLRQAEEECCDAGVVASLPELAGSYASALVRSLTFATEPSSPCPSLTSGMGPVNLLKRRLNMMREKVQRRLGVRAWLMLLAIAGVILPVGFTWASDDDPAPLPRRSEARQDRPRRESAERGERGRAERSNPDDDDPPPVPDRPGRTPRLPALPQAPSGVTSPITPVPATGMAFGGGMSMGMMGGDAGGELRHNAEIAVKQAELEVRLRQVKMKQAESEVKYLQADLQRLEKSRPSVSESEVMVARSRVEMSRTNVELAQIEVERAGLGLEQAKHRLETISRRESSGRPGMAGMGGMMSTPAVGVPSIQPPGNAPPAGGGRGGSPVGGGPPGGFGAGQFGPGAGGLGGGDAGPGAGFGRGEGSGRGFQGGGGGGGFGGGPGIPGAGAVRNRARGERSERGDAIPPADRGDNADPRDRVIQELEHQLKDLRQQLDELRKRRPDGPGRQ